MRSMRGDAYGGRSGFHLQLRVYVLRELRFRYESRLSELRWGVSEATLQIAAQSFSIV
jgi:hypothetical protein